MSTSNPLLHAFFIGRAIADIANEQLEKVVADSLSALGTFDAEQRDRLREFSEEVLARAAQAEAEAAGSSGTATSTGSTATATESEDLQTRLDDLRAEIAELRSDLKQVDNSDASE
ncbi:MAG: DUF6825 family protein [Cyanobacteria bacterium P01_D01_bin.73]